MKFDLRGPGLALIVALAVGSWGCAARWAYRQGKSEAKKGNWDLAVARLTKALQKDPDNVSYKIALENARVQASRQHYKEAKEHLAAEELEKAADELEIASKYDPGNKSAADDLALVRERIRKREEEKQRLSEFEATKARAQAARVPLPVLSPRDPVPITLKFTETSLEKIFETLAKLSGVNILMDQDYRDKKVTVNLANVTFEEALNQITFVNRLFYKVLDQNTLIIVPESPQKRRSYDENLVQTFYLQNAEVNETVTLVRNLTGITKVAGNVSLGAITVMANPDKLALAGKIIENNDKAKGEVMVEVEILEVNRQRLKNYGLELAGAYEASVTFSPFGAGETSAAGVTSVRAHLLSSLNLSDFIVNIPSTLFARFLQTDSNVRLLASPRLRAAEGKKTSLKIVSQIPIAQTTFQATTTGGATFTPTTTIQYKDVGVTLDLTPKVNAKGEITLEMAAEFSLQGQNIDVGGSKQPSFLTRNLNGILRLRDGETSLIGGLLQGRDAENFRGALGVEHIPLLNKLFNSTQKQKDETEILISITPHIVRGPKVTEEDLKPLFAGTEETVRVPSARPPLFGTPEPSPSPSPAPAPHVAPPPVPPPAQAPAPQPQAVPRPQPHTEGAPVVPSDAGSSAGATARFTPADATVKVGEQAALSLVLFGARDVVSVDVVIAYDPVVVEAVEIAPGALLSLDGAGIKVERSLESGKARARFTRPKGASGSGAVAAVTFKGLRPGVAIVGVESLTAEMGILAERPPVLGPGRIVVVSP